MLNPNLPASHSSESSESSESSDVSQAALHLQIKHLIVKHLLLKMDPEQIPDDQLLFASEGLGLDSIDALELAVAVEKTFGLPIPNAEVAQKVFVSVETLAEFVRQGQEGRERVREGIGR